PAIINTPFTPALPSRSPRLLRQIQQDSDGNQTGDQRRAAVAHQRQRQSLRRQQAQRDADVDQRLDADQQRESQRRVKLEAPVRVTRDAEAAPHQEREQREQPERADEAELLADDGEDEVGVRLGEEKEFLPAVADAEAAQSAGADGDQALHGLESL